jgi:hypothetical protein
MAYRARLSSVAMCGAHKERTLKELAHAACTRQELGRNEILFLLPGEERRNYTWEGYHQDFKRVMDLLLRKMLQVALVHDELNSGIYSYIVHRYWLGSLLLASSSRS